MLNQLLWKDIQNQKFVILLGLFCLLGPYCFLLLPQAPSGMVVNIATMSLMLSLLTIAIMGATVIGDERHSQGMDFLLAMPVSRSKVLLSKAIISLIVAAIIWGYYFAVVELFAEAEVIRGFRYVGSVSASIGAGLFGLAWLGSVYFRRVAGSILFAAGVSAVVAFAIFRIWAVYEWNAYLDGEMFCNVLQVTYTSIGVASFAGGWIAFIRRFES